MRFGLVLALLFSAILIGGASWWRFGNTATPVIVGLEQVSKEDSYSDEEILKELTTPKPADIQVATTTPETLTGTDIITRNLFMSYMNTAVNSGGVVNTNTLNSIANQYVNETAGLHTFKNVSIQEISLIADNETNARKYANELSKIYSTYTWEITLLTKDPKNTVALAAAYENMSNALKTLPVPISISLLHLQLVNNQASTAAAVRNMEKVETDPIKTIAGLAAIKENVSKETSTLANIDRILREKYDTL